MHTYTVVVDRKREGHAVSTCWFCMKIGFLFAKIRPGICTYAPMHMHKNIQIHKHTHSHTHMPCCTHIVMKHLTCTLPVRSLFAFSFFFFQWQVWLYDGILMYLCILYRYLQSLIPMRMLEFMSYIYIYIYHTYLPSARTGATAPPSPDC